MRRAQLCRVVSHRLGRRSYCMGSVVTMPLVHVIVRVEPMMVTEAMVSPAMSGPGVTDSEATGRLGGATGALFGCLTP
eukprot:10708278-Heterocapsa_arctica.AAC.1